MSAPHLGQILRWTGFSFSFTYPQYLQTIAPSVTRNRVSAWSHFSQRICMNYTNARVVLKPFRGSILYLVWYLVFVSSSATGVVGLFCIVVLCSSCLFDIPSILGALPPLFHERKIVGATPGSGPPPLSSWKCEIINGKKISIKWFAEPLLTQSKHLLMCWWIFGAWKGILIHN